MLRAIEFKDKRFMTKDGNNLFSPITKNAIILCHNYRLMNSLSNEILDTVNGQRITLALEPAIIYKANDINDIWLFCYKGTDEIEPLPVYEEYIYPVIVYKGSYKMWQDGKDEMYKMICNGRYGTYDGQWVDLHGEHWDEEAHNCVAECNMHIND